jgi:hypothetical protein
MSRAIRHSEAGKIRMQRKKRGGKYSHPSGNYGRVAGNQAPPASQEPPAEQDAADAPAHTPGPVSLPRLTCLTPKKIAGEWI